MPAAPLYCFLTTTDTDGAATGSPGLVACANGRFPSCLRCGGYRASRVPRAVANVAEDNGRQLSHPDADGAYDVGQSGRTLLPPP